MNHIHDFKMVGTKLNTHAGKVGSWVKAGKLTSHKPTFFKDHLAGTFHHSGLDTSITLPSEQIVILKLLP